MLCWLKEDTLESGHGWIWCQELLDEKRKAMNKMRTIQVPQDKGREYVCYSCYLPSETFPGFQHGTMNSQNDCTFAHLFKPFLWGCWHFEGLRAELVTYFQPTDRAGKKLKEEEQWAEFFRWCFRKKAGVGLMNYLCLLLWAKDRSTSFQTVYGPNEM